jgi:hypothetical protein
MEQVELNSFSLDGEDRSRTMAMREKAAGSKLQSVSTITPIRSLALTPVSTGGGASMISTCQEKKHFSLHSPEGF